MATELLNPVDMSGDAHAAHAAGLYLAGRTLCLGGSIVAGPLLAHAVRHLIVARLCFNEPKNPPSREECANALALFERLTAVEQKLDIARFRGAIVSLQKSMEAQVPHAFGWVAWGSWPDHVTESAPIELPTLDELFGILWPESVLGVGLLVGVAGVTEPVLKPLYERENQFALSGESGSKEVT